MRRRIRTSTYPATSPVSCTGWKAAGTTGWSTWCSPLGEMRGALPAVYQGLGGSFDVYVGRVRRAPVWWVERNLEWLYRLVQEPKRIGRQVHLLRFLFRLYAGRF